MPPSLKRAVMVGVVVLATSCGDDGPGPTSPTLPQTITVSGSGILLNGRSETYAASTTGCSWGSDAPTVVRIDATSGQVTALAAGKATIWCDAQGTRGTKLIEVYPNFQWTWHGTWVMSSCTASGELAESCSGFESGSQMGFKAIWTQNTDRVSGSFSFDREQGTGAGFVGSSYDLLFTGRATFQTSVYDTVWRLRSDRLAEMTGSVSMSITRPGSTGSVVIDGSVVNVLGYPTPSP